ncbi:MAG: PAS domain S-box-containing protein [Bradymonadia bacterium]
MDPGTSVSYAPTIHYSRSLRPLTPRTKSAQLRVLSFLVSALVIVATIWSVKFAVEVHELRDEISVRVGWLIEVRGIERSILGDTDEGIPAQPDEAAAAAHRLAESVRVADPELANAIEAIREMADDPDRALAAAGAIVDQIRSENATISVALGAHIDRLNWIVAIIVIAAGLIVILFGRGFSNEGVAGRAILRANALTQQMDYLAASSPAMLYTARCREPYDYAFVSPNVARIFGLRPEELTQENGRRSWAHPDDESNAERGLIVAQQRGRHVHEYRVMTVRGDYRWIRDEVRAPDEETGLMVGCIIDITDRRAADAALKEVMASMEVRIGEAVRDVEENAERLEAIVGAAMDAVILVQADGAILQANKACGIIFGHDPITLTRENASLLFADGSWAPPAGSEVQERVGRRSDGSNVPVEISTGRTAGIFGKPVLVLVIRDISERTENRQRLEERNNALASTNADLKTFTAAASHDMKEPLRKIRAFAGLLGESDDDLSDATLQYMHYMDDAAGRLTHLVDDLVEYAQAGRSTLHFELVSLDDLVGYVMDDLEVAISESGATFTFDSLGEVCADSNQLRRVFQNLISNGIRYAKHDEAPQIHLSREDLEGFAVIEVCDTGIGFDPQYADHIFVPFKRLQRSNSRDGTGIGLAICRKIVHGHGGTVVADGAPGQGAKFTIKLPLSSRQVAPSDA